MENNKEKTQYYRIQGRVSIKEREEYLALKEAYEKSVLQGVKITDGMYLMAIARETSRLKED